ncbi:hypothetical protein HBI81_164620 [Parastagonospora nodorum]|nr:hypothetical protein HBI10_193110 [Parastagonospora nodorum]KAH4008583.1 hypothetical protein HBI13_232790 [Parastagonospora nodorum]KAH4062741.1 hypothetical protein HBH50_201090 [Parastagonospora nodorum]KAH4081502.1 hypothetical protein HBH48_196740 [Parastagonospora nodorum]KAH4285210.1 hypothetical protein HBI02_234380 [Parastagonospora nodorum]
MKCCIVQVGTPVLAPDRPRSPLPLQAAAHMFKRYNLATPAPAAAAAAAQNPRAQAHPYVYRHEVDAHLAAIRAGAPSPLRRSIDKAQHAEAQKGEYHLWYPASNRSKPHTDTDSARQAH